MMGERKKKQKQHSHINADYAVLMFSPVECSTVACIFSKTNTKTYNYMSATLQYNQRARQ